MPKGYRGVFLIMAADSISVIIPTCVRSERLLVAIDGVLEQSEHPLEIIVSDSDPAGSARQVCDEHGLFSVVHIDASAIKGVSHARNTGAQEARGEWIAFLDDDDRWSSKYLENALARGQHTNVEMILTPFIRDYFGRAPNGKKPEEGVSIELLLRDGNFGIVGSNIFIRSRVFRSIGGFDRLLPTSEVIDLLIKFVRGGFNYAVVPDALVMLSTHDDPPLRESGSMSLYQGTKRLYEKYARLVSGSTKRRLSGRVHGRGFDAEQDFRKKLGHAAAAALNGNMVPVHDSLRALKRALSIPRRS